MFIPIRELNVFMQQSNCYFFFDDTPFLPLENQKDKADKRVYDFVISFMHHLNIIKDELKVGSENVIRFARFDDLENTAEVLNFSENISGDYIFKPRVDGYGQNNYIKFKEVYPEGDELLNSKNIRGLNVNLDVNVDLFEIDAYVPSTVVGNGTEISYMADKESFKTFTFYVSDEYTPYNVITNYSDYVQGESEPGVFTRNDSLQIAKLYSLDSEYNFLDEIIDYPKFYEIEKWLTINDIRNFEFFKQYYVRELNGSFFINKISGFNPKSKEPTKIELLRVGNRTPIYPPDANPWIDGVGNIWTDGVGDFYF
jgi:hypothetical protein